MSRQSLTDVAVHNLTAPHGAQVEIWDARVPGFGVRASPAGAKAFVFVYRFNGRPRRMTLGRYPTTSLSDARRLAQEALNAVAHGTDPGAEKIKARRIEPFERFDSFVEHFIETYARPKNRSADETARLLRREFVSKLGNRPIGRITKHDITTILDRSMREDKHTTANRSLAAIRKLFNWAVERGHIEQSPCAGLRAPANLISRDRVLSDDELVAVWKGAARMSYPYGPLVHLSILTGQRLDEVAGMQWSELNTTDAFWSIAASRNKSARPHEVPLPPSAIRVIATIPKITERYVFPARSRDVPVSGFSKWKSELDQLSKVEGWRVHDLRRTAATGMAKLGIAPHVVERVLNHKSGTLGGIAGVYNRFGYLTEMRAALDAWSDHLGRLRPSTDDMARSK